MTEQADGNSNADTRPRNAAPVLWQVPPPPADAIDRTTDTDALAQAFRELVTTDGNTIVALSGETGMGTTTLAQIWAHRTRELYPGGQLYIDGAAYTTRDGMAVTDALGDCLRALGVSNDDVPTRSYDRRQLYQQMLAERSPMLVVLDYATAPAQVRAFAPPPGRGKVLSTSRQSMNELRVDGACLATLPPMSEPISITLLRNLCGPERIDHDPAATSRLAALCGGRPLDLRIAAAQLAFRVHLTIGAYVNEIDVDTELPVIDHAYRHLTPKAVVFYHRLAAVRGLASITAHTASIAGRTDATSTRRLLSELTTAGLLVYDTSLKYWAFPRLVARHAHKHTQQSPQSIVNEVAADLAEHYLPMTCVARRALTGQSMPHDVALPRKFHHPFTGPNRVSRAMDWLVAERPNVLGVLEVVSRDDSRQAWRLALALTDMLVDRHHFLDALEAIDHGIYAASLNGGREAPAALLRLWLTRARIYLDLGRPEVARDDLRVIRDLAASADDIELTESLRELRSRLE